MLVPTVHFGRQEDVWRIMQDNSAASTSGGVGAGIADERVIA